ncbi:MAG: DUF3237 family protein [Deltaproteobacteria bacterium]|nr:DUF3237 family protein [Deltaproteobacteria bacterium]
MELEFAFEVRLLLGTRLHFPISGGGERGFVPVVGGEFKGPRIEGVVLPGGGDWPYIRQDGVVEFDARYLLQASDGTHIYLRNRGFRHAPPEIAEKMEACEPVDPESYYFRVSPVFEVPAGPHDWLSRMVFVGRADRRTDHSLFQYFVVR